MGWSEFGKVRKIGEGSFGKAWLVKSHKDQASYVIKEINISRVLVYYGFWWLIGLHQNASLVQRCQQGSVMKHAKRLQSWPKWSILTSFRILIRLKVEHFWAYQDTHLFASQFYFIQELGNLCIVMDYCDGGDLYSRITSQRNVSFTEDQVTPYMIAQSSIHFKKQNIQFERYSTGLCK